MKKLVVLGILLVAFAATASAQTDRPLRIYAGGGVGIPMSDVLKDGWKLGFHGKLAVGYTLPAVQALELMGKFEYHSFASDVEGLDGGDLRPMLFGADAKFKFGPPAAPTKFYALGGLGMASVSRSDETVGGITYEYDSQSEFYLNGGLGVDLKPGEAFGIFAEARIVAILTEGETTLFIPITAGFAF